MNTRVFSRRRRAGFTLIELMITVGILAIVAAIAYPTYMGSVRKARRADGKEALLDLAGRQEKFYYTNSTYTSVLANLGWSTGQSPNGYYVLAIPAADASGFTITATPQGEQASDTCGAFSIDEAGNKTPVTDGCW